MEQKTETDCSKVFVLLWEGGDVEFYTLTLLPPTLLKKRLSLKKYIFFNL